MPSPHLPPIPTPTCPPAGKNPGFPALSRAGRSVGLPVAALAGVRSAEGKTRQDQSCLWPDWLCSAFVLFGLQNQPTTLPPADPSGFLDQPASKPGFPAGQNHKSLKSNETILLCFSPETPNL